MILSFGSSSPVLAKKRHIGANASGSGRSKTRTSRFRGVTRQKATGRYEAHLWDNTTWNSLRNTRGKQRAYDVEENAARSYDLAALKYWGRAAILNFPIQMYDKEIKEMLKVSKDMYLASLKRQSSGFSRGTSKYRGVARHHHNGRWEARIGLVSGKKYTYLGTYATEEEAAIAYDKAAVQLRGQNAVTNFEISNYIDKLTEHLNVPAQVIQEEIHVEEHNNNYQESSASNNDEQSHEHELNSLYSQNIAEVKNWDDQQWNQSFDYAFNIPAISDDMINFDWSFGDGDIFPISHESQLSSENLLSSQGEHWNDQGWDLCVHDSFDFDISPFFDVMIYDDVSNN